MKAPRGRDFLRNRDLTEISIERLWRLVAYFQTTFDSGERTQSSELMDGEVLAIIYAGDDIRTRFAFEAAMLRLGGRCNSTTHVERSSSLVKGESAYDMGKVVGNGAVSNIIVCSLGTRKAEREFAKGSAVPVVSVSILSRINATDENCLWLCAALLVLASGRYVPFTI